MNRREIIRQLNISFLRCQLKERSLLISSKPQNDIRVTFYKHMMNVIDSSIHLVIFSDTHIFTENWWSETLPKYGIHRRLFALEEIRDREISIDYLDQHIIFSYFLFVYSSFEHSLRVICRHSYPNIYTFKNRNGEKRKRDFKTQFEMLVRELKFMDNNLQNFIEIVVKFRNSIHNNGDFITEKVNTNEEENYHTYVWNDETYEFKNGSSIRVNSNDLWSDYIKFTDELIRIFGELVSQLTDPYIEDVTEPT